MTQRNENSVLFSLSNLQQMAMAPKSTTATSPGIASPTPVLTGPGLSGSSYVPVGMPSTMLLAPKTTWPRWMAPVIISLGVLFIVFLVLALAIALRPPAYKPVVPQQIATPAPTPTPEGNPVKTAPILAPKVEKTAPLAEEKGTDPQPREVAPAENVTKIKKKVRKKRRLSKWARRRRLRRLRRRRRRRRRRLRAKRRRKRRKRVAARNSTFKPYRKLNNNELDDLLNSAMK